MTVVCDHLGCTVPRWVSEEFPQRAGILVVVVPLLVLVFDLRNKLPLQILVDLSVVSVHLDPNRGKTTNWMRGRVNGSELPISILVDPIIRRPANVQT